MEPFKYISTLLSIIIGLGITHLLVGVSRLVYNPKKVRIYWIHLVWTISIFVYMVFFWWFEFKLSLIEEWTFQLYLFVIFYSVLLFLAAVINMPFYFPDDLKEYYYTSRKWFFGVFIGINVIDLIDTLVKGTDHFLNLGIGYIFFVTSSILFGCMALFTKKEILHACIAIIFALYQIWYGLTAFNSLPA